jgi:hypothetical protein
MTSNNRLPQQSRNILILTIALLGGLVAVVIVQQTRIRTLEHANANAVSRMATPDTRSAPAQARPGDLPSVARDRRRPENTLDHARIDDAKSVETQLAEISAPLHSDMASTMFNADVKTGQSVVTGGYQTADGRYQFTILKPRVVADQNGGQQIEIDSNLIAMSHEDTQRSGLNSLATNAKNTLQHAEYWNDADVSGTMELLQESTDSEHLGQPKTFITPGEKFTIEMAGDDHSFYTLTGTAELSPDSSGVVLKARIEQREKQD